MFDTKLMAESGVFSPRAVEIAQKYEGLGGGGIPLSALTSALALVDLRTPMIASRALPPHPYFQFMLFRTITQMGATTIADRVYRGLESELHGAEKRRLFVEFAGELAESATRGIIDFEGKLLDKVYHGITQNTDLLRLIAMTSGNANLCVLALAGRGAEQERALQAVRSTLNKTIVEPFRPTINYVGEQVLAACLQFYSTNQRPIDKETLVDKVEEIFTAIDAARETSNKAARTTPMQRMFARSMDKLLKAHYIQMFVDPNYSPKVAG